MCPDRISIDNTMIAVTAIIKADYNPTARRLTLILVDKSESELRGDLAEATWDFLTSRVYGCFDPLSLWESATTKAKVTHYRSSEIRVNE